MACHTSKHQQTIVIIQPLSYSPSFYTYHDQDSTPSSRQKATDRHPQELRSYNSTSGDGAGEAHKAQSGEEGQEKGARETEEGDFKGCYADQHERSCVA